MAKKVTRTVTVAEAAKQLGVSAARVAALSKTKGFDVASRDPKHLTVDEVKTLRDELAKKTM